MEFVKVLSTKDLAPNEIEGMEVNGKNILIVVRTTKKPRLTRAPSLPENIESRRR